MRMRWRKIKGLPPGSALPGANCHKLIGDNAGKPESSRFAHNRGTAG